MKHLSCFLLLFLLFVSCQQETYYNVTLQSKPEECGIIKMTPSSHSVLEGTSVTFKATPISEYVFTGWSGSLSGTENPKTVSVTADMTVVANFELKTYPLTVSVEGEGTVNERVISTKTDYDFGTVVELTAQPAPHWVFDHWEGGLNGNTNPVQISVTSATIVKAVFVKKMYDLTIVVEGEGAVSEVVVETKSSSYQEGTEVELTATPATGWSFDRWEGDLSGADNTIKLTISGAMSIKAVFAKNKYTYNLKIVGPGVVDEYLVPETKASLNYGTNVLLKAFPADGAVFKGWSGDISGNELEKIVNIDGDLEIVSIFEFQEVPYISPVNLKLPSRCYPRIYPHINLQSIGAFPTLSVQLDYDRDGYIDVISFPSKHKQDSRQLIRFYKGGRDRSLDIDALNDSKIPGLVDSRKGIYGDYNDDGLPDICIIGGGYDAPPYPGDFPLILLSDASSRKYNAIVFEDCKGFWHGGTSGDIDNDGDLDIFLIQAWHGDALFFINDGVGNFTIRNDLFRQEMRDGMYNCELYDFDKDGFLDLIVGAHDHANSPEGQYKNMPIIFWGNGENYTEGEYSQLSETPIVGMGVVNDFYPYDLDGDGVEELILIRTGDGERNPSIDFYEGWCVQVFKRLGRMFQDVTYDFFNKEDVYQTGEHWIAWIEMIHENGGQYLYFHDYDGVLRKMFMLSDKQFIKVQNEEQRFPLITNGHSILSSTITMLPEWKKYASSVITFSDGLDLTYLVDNGFVLEYSIQNNDPSLSFDFHFDAFRDETSYEMVKYGTGGHMENLKNDGSWELIRFPLTDFQMWDDAEGNFWNRIHQFVFITTSEGGQEFSVKDIRIRKVLPE